MKINAPAPSQLPQLKQLWHLAFHEEEAFLNLFFDTGFAPERCRCILAEDRVLAAVYWFDTECDGKKLAYLYGVATHPAAQGRGLCRKLMADTAAHLTKLGYDGILLVPQKEDLRAMYAGFGYREATSLTEFFCVAVPEPQPMHLIDRADYERLRRDYLPDRAVVQEGVCLDFLAGYAKFYKGLGFLLCAVADGDSLMGIELLGDRDAAPRILCSLGFHQGTFRCPGDKKPFAMFLPLKPDAPTPAYFGLAFD